MRRVVLLLAALATLPATSLGADDAPSAERGRKALLGRHFTAPTIPLGAYDNAWRVWDREAKEPPADYAARFRERFHVQPGRIYLDGNSLGLLSRDAEQAVARVLAQWKEHAIGGY